MKIRRGDMVRVITGDDKGTVARVLRVLNKQNRVVVEGVNKVLKHVRPSQRNPKGGQLSKEMPIHVSNVLLYNAELGKGVRHGVKANPDGSKSRVCRKTGRELGTIRPAKS